MKKQTTITAAIYAVVMLVALTGIVSCKKDLVGSGPTVTETRSLPSFSAIDLQMNGNVYYKTDSVSKVEIIAKQSIHPILQTSVNNQALVIRYNDGSTYDADESIRITVYGPSVNRLSLTTSGSIYTDSDIHTPNLVLRSSGSGNISLKKVTATNILAESLQSGTISATLGTAVTGNLKSDASGKINIAGITAVNATARTIGSGDIQVTATGNLDATIDGSGSIYFGGYPSITSHVHGTGRLIRL